MKIALVQINPIIGDFDHNCALIKSWAEKAQHNGCRLAIFPEMAVSGYPPQDLLERESFINQQQMAVDKLVTMLPRGIDVLFGCFEQRNSHTGKSLYNAAIVARDGEIIFHAHKQLLPSYDVFDETRYFQQGEVPDLYILDDHTFGITICEDIWHHEIGVYAREPVALLKERAEILNTPLDCIINISASPFQRDKEKQRHGLFERLCSKHELPLIYVNQVGGQDSLLFDGRSMLVGPQGKILAKGAGFTEDMTIIDSKNWHGEITGMLLDDEVEAVFSALVMGVRDYVHKCGFKSAVLGLSGGIDSALTAAIAVEALGCENVLCVALPSKYSSPASKEDAEQLAAALGCRFEVVPIIDLFETFQHTLAPIFAGHDDDLTEQNIQARLRGNILMALSNKFGSLLLATGNKSEMAVGYCTLYGDMSGGLAVISDVPKQLVYDLARFINKDKEIIPQRILTKAPTAELKPDQCDQDDLPPYELLDQILQLHLEEGLDFEEITAQGFEQEIVLDVLRRIRLNEYKRKQAPMGLKVTSKAFGYGRRYPNVQNFQYKPGK
ncbi:MAG: NAD+ synthase [Desulfocapsaceae bacterium]|nr:NAD+ synthase [Desulfocapsaceae bacterium]